MSQRMRSILNTSQEHSSTTINVSKDHAIHTMDTVMTAQEENVGTVIGGVDALR
jgi:hypothetical protein